MPPIGGGVASVPPNTSAFRPVARRSQGIPRAPATARRRRSPSVRPYSVRAAPHAPSGPPAAAWPHRRRRRRREATARANRPLQVRAVAGISVRRRPGRRRRPSAGSRVSGRASPCHRAQHREDAEEADGVRQERSPQPDARRSARRASAGPNRPADVHAQAVSVRLAAGKSPAGPAPARSPARPARRRRLLRRAGRCRRAGAAPSCARRDHRHRGAGRDQQPASVGLGRQSPPPEREQG